MPGYAITSPAAAFSGSIQDMMVEQARAEQVAFQNALALKREQDLDEAKTAALQEKREKVESDLHEKERNDTLKDIANMEIGDIPDADLMTRAKKHQIPIRMVERPAVPASLPVSGVAPPMTSPVTAPGAPGAPTPTPAAPAVLPAPAVPPQTPAVPAALTFGGSPKQREDQKKQDRIKQIEGILTSAPPDSPAYKQAMIDYEMESGKSLPVGLTKPAPEAKSEAMLRQNPRGDGPPERFNPTTQKWEPLAGEPPVGAHWMTEQLPKSTDAADTRTEARVQAAREHGYAELKDRTKKVDDQIDALDTLDISLRQKDNNEADGLVVTELLKGTIAGGGVRITQPEIDQELSKARTTWDSLMLTLNKWKADGSKGNLILTEEQKTGIRALSSAIRRRAMQQHHALIDARTSIDTATSVQDVNKYRTAGEDKRYEGSAAPDDVVGATLPPGVTVKKKGG